MTGTANGQLRRERLLEVIRADPGIHVRRLARVAGIGWTTCEHHLRCLEQAGKVTRRRVQGRSQVFAAGALAANQFGGAGLLRDRRNACIAAAVIQQPGSAQGLLSAQTGIPASSLCRRLQALSDEGLVERIGQGRGLRVHPTQALRSTMGAVEESTGSLLSGVLA